MRQHDSTLRFHSPSDEKGSRMVVNMQHATAKLTKLVRNLATDAYDYRGYLKSGYDDNRGRGSFRACIFRDGVAIKLTRRESGVDMNRREWELFARLPDSVKSLTAKPLAISLCGRVMAIEMISGGTLSDWEIETGCSPTGRLQKFNKKLEDLLAINGFDDVEIESLIIDNHENNVAIRDNGELCWIDFAAYG
jgi:hypothetical protein